MRGSIIRRGKDSWLLKFDKSMVGGRRKFHYATVRGSRQDAQRELARLLVEADKGTLPDLTKATVGEYLRDWLDSAHTQSLKTRERYSELARCQIAPRIGGIALQKLRPEDLQRWHKALIEGGLSARTVTNAHKLLHRVLADAVRNGTIARNVAAIRRPPRVEEVEVEILAPEQIATVLAKLEGHSLLPIVSLALATGMRRGELLALRWQDVDLDAGHARVEHSLEETKVGKLRFKCPKTRRGRRNIKLPGEAVAMLREHRKRQIELRLALGQGGQPTLVFSDVEGEPLKPHTISRAWQRVVAARGLPAVTFHALRHTHASMLIRAGVDILTISRRLGHTKAAITLDVYGHLVGGADEAAAAAIEGVLK